MSLVDEIREKLSTCLEPTYVPFDHEDIDKFVSNGGNFGDAVIVHSLSEIKDCHHIKTKHGFIGFNYNPYFPPNSMWIVNQKVVGEETDNA
ncbi:hypothetical protein A3842_11125 [Paenibacillus sp. P3E]|uniref:hypothetical protein n=1 Tax=Paenibacillus sp. P3E TaxID=1349435 RepID=UPI00093C3B01|nr:hypothetical protein [Paenibacillus sp. P3E]OKP81623.1 hypothetical protein A3842_11125 [Paenibacillus sp. P3E]